MNKQRQRKLDARQRRRDSLVNAFPSPIQAPMPKNIVITKKDISKKPETVIVKKTEQVKRGPGRPPKNYSHLNQEIKKTGKVKEKQR